ncbi:MAG: hypothetical protein WB542_05905, partial [Polaromonas sp.]
RMRGAPRLVTPIPLGFDCLRLCGKRARKSVAKLTRQDDNTSFSLVAKVPLKIHMQALRCTTPTGGTKNGTAALIP